MCCWLRPASRSACIPRRKTLCKAFCLAAWPLARPHQRIGRESLLRQGHLGIMQLLNRYGGQLDIPNNQGWTPLHRAVYNGHIRVMEWLLNNGASIHFVNQ